MAKEVKAAKPKKQIVYLFGAGASYEALPVYADFVKRLERFWSYILKLEIEPHPVYVEALNQIKKFKTPDTYAAALTLRKEEKKLAILKTLITLFIGYEQFFKPVDEFEAMNRFGMLNNDGWREIEREHNTIDQRYISFLCTICLHESKQELTFPNNINFISWNYDAQIELAFSRVFDKVQPLNEIRNEIEVARIGKPSGRLIKLNGSADFNSTNNAFYDLNIDKVSSFNDSLTLLKTAECLDTLINFGFGVYEKELGDDTIENRFIRKIRYAARQRLRRADVIVIIGYSFPDFNRRIDKSIFLNVKDNVEIYVQDVNAEQVIEKLNGVKTGFKDKAKPVTNVDQFWIPYDFWE